MSAIATARSSLATSLVRYWRSWGLWLLLLVAPIGARYMLRIEEGGVIIAVGGQLPEMTSAFLGVSLGIVVTTLLLPVGWLYLRSNTTRRQPWQVEEATPASRIAIALGRFSADVVVLFATLAALTLAGWFLGWLLLPLGDLNLVHITFALWLVAAPALMGLAALRILFDARPLTRSGFGDFAYFVVWMASLIAPVAAQGKAPGLAANMYDFAGFVTPLQFGAPGRTGDFTISIGGGMEVLPGNAQLDVLAGLLSPGYIESRVLWIGIAIAVTVLAGLIYHPHLPRRRTARLGWLTSWLLPGAPPRAISNAPAAREAALSWVNLAVAEFRLIGAGRIFLLLAAGVAILSYAADFRHVASPAALLLLIFGLTAHAGRSEARGLLALTRVAPFAPIWRRVAFVAAGAGWTTFLALPALTHGSGIDAVGVAAATGAIAALVATGLASLSGSGFAPRLVLLILWYGYLSY